MSLSETEKVELTVSTRDQAAEIFVIDGQLQLRDRGIGRLTTAQEPGIYKVKVRAGLETREDLVILRGPAVIKSYDWLSFSSPLPLQATAKAHDVHGRVADSESRRVHVKAGAGSSVFVMVRELTPPETPDDALKGLPSLATGLTLTTLTGERIADLTEASESSSGRDPWSACCVEVDPGPYLLQLTTPAGDVLVQTVTAAPTWQSQIFLLPRAYGPPGPRPGQANIGRVEEAAERRADLAGAAVLLAGQPGFRTNDESARLMELARLGLTNRRAVLSADVRRMLDGKFENPMLGLFGAHLLLVDPQPDRRLVHAVVENLRRMLRAPQADVEAIALRTDDRRDHEFAVPPMLRKSWSLIVEASVTASALVPRDSLSARAAERLCAVEPWLLWLAPPPAKAETAGELAATETSEEPSMLEAMLEANLTYRDRFSDRLRSHLPRGVQQFLAGVKAAAHARRPDVSDDVVNALVQRLGIPRGNVEALIDRVQRRTGKGLE